MARDGGGGDRSAVSVAFRRESDEERKEPRFELPIPPGPNLVTTRGLALIAARVAALHAALAAEADPAARAALQRDLRYWSTRETTANRPAPAGPGIAAFGTRVTLLLDGARRTIEIVGADESDPATGRIGFQAPLARAVIGAGRGDTLDFAGRGDAIEILAIEPIGS